MKCVICGKERTNEPDYNPMALLLGLTEKVGWYDGDDGSFCPEDMEKLFKTSNSTERG